jgi:tRNA-binding protein
VAALAMGLGELSSAMVTDPPRQIGKFMSEVLTLGLSDEAGEVVLIGPERAVPNGGRMFYANAMLRRTLRAT